MKVSVVSVFIVHEIRRFSNAVCVLLSGEPKRSEISTPAHNDIASDNIAFVIIHAHLNALKEWLLSLKC